MWVHRYTMSKQSGHWCWALQHGAVRDAGAPGRAVQVDPILTPG